MEKLCCKLAAESYALGVEAEREDGELVVFKSLGQEDNWWQINSIRSGEHREREPKSEVRKNSMCFTMFLYQVRLRTKLVLNFYILSLPLFATSVHAVCVKWLHSCPTLCDPMDYSRPGSSVHGILQARMLERVAVPFSRGFSWPRDGTHVFCVCCISRWVVFLTTNTTWEAHLLLESGLVLEYIDILKLKDETQSLNRFDILVVSL